MQTTAWQEAAIRLSAGAGKGTAVVYNQGWMVASMMIEPWKGNHQSNCLFAPLRMLVLVACDNSRALCRPPIGGLICDRWLLTCGWHLHSVVCVVRPDKYCGTVLLVQGAILRTKTAAIAKSRTQRPSHWPTCRGFCFALNGVEMERDAPCSTLDSQACVYQRLIRHTTIQNACIPRAYSPMSCWEAHGSEHLHDVCLLFLVMIEPRTCISST